MNQTVIKIIAFILIASIVVEFTLGAPMTKESSSTDKPKNQKNSHRRRQTGSKHLKNGDDSEISKTQRKLFKKINPNLWRNACNQNSMPTSSSNDINVDNFEPYKNSMLTELNVEKSKLQSLQAINISQIDSWEEFHNSSFEFLPVHPKGLALPWHEHAQIYVASFAVLLNISRQNCNESVCSEENRKIMDELMQMFEGSQKVLCEIETFINGTLNKNDGSNLINWYNKHDIMKRVHIPGPGEDGTMTKEKISYVFVAGRFLQYIKRLYDRVEKFNVDKNKETVNSKLLKSHRRSHNKLQHNRRKNRRNQKRRSTTRNFKIFTTQRPAIEKNNNNKSQKKAPEQRRKFRINTSLQN